MKKLNDQFIRQIIIDWNKIETHSYLRKIPALCGLDRLEFTRPVTFFVGENGSGKSTLLEAIAVAYGFNPEGGTRNYNFSTYDSHSGLHEAITIAKGYRRARGGYFLRAESFYNVASKAEAYRDGELPETYYARYGGKSLRTMPGTEGSPSISAPTGRASWPWSRTASAEKGCTCWTSRRRPCRPRAF